MRAVIPAQITAVAHIIAEITIAKSGSFDFKSDPEHKDKENIDIIGQFCVGYNHISEIRRLLKNNETPPRVTVWSLVAVFLYIL